MPPALFLYFKYSLISNFKLSWKSGLHLLPFIILNLLMLPDIYLIDLSTTTGNEELLNIINIILYISIYIQSFTYIVFTYLLLIKRKHLYTEYYSNTDIRQYNYLFQLNSMLLAIFILSAAGKYIFYNIEGSPEAEYARHIVLFSTLIMFCWIILKGLQSPELFQGEGFNPIPVSTLVKEDSAVFSSERKSDTSIRSKEILESINRLTGYMKENEPFMDSSLSIFKLANQIEIPSKDLSIIINHHMKKHFFDFINEYRIEKAKMLLKDPDKVKWTILEILYEVGFNSKSSFNTAFKKHAGTTPTLFRAGSLY